MVQTVELLLEDAGEAAVLEQWRVLADADLPSQSRHAGATNRPHVTLAVAGQMPAVLDGPLAAAAGALPLPARLGGLLVLGGRRLVLARLVVAGPALLDLHAGVADVVAGCPDRSELLRPGAWTPHVTLARHLDPDQLARAVTALGAAGLTGEADVTLAAVRRFDGDARTVRDLRAGAPPSP